jgi:DNA-binding transcriptional regulator GbsR (MarR family)
MDKLSPAAHRFILHWGEMSTRWGINRSMAQMHALLYLSPEALTAEQIADILKLARSNVSTGIRELRAWGVVRVVHRLGDRRDYFECVHDVWELLLAILEQRKRREVDPTIEVLQQCIQEAERTKNEDPHTRGRMRELFDLLTSLTSWYEDMVSLPTATQKRVLRLGGKISKLTG